MIRTASFTIAILGASVVWSQPVIEVGGNTLELISFGDCGIYREKFESSAPNAFLTTYSWDGLCINGLAEGYGKLTTSIRSSTNVNDEPFLTTREGFLRAGIAIGHALLVNKVLNHWVYSYGEQTVSAHIDVVRINAESVRNKSVELPKVNFNIHFKAEGFRQYFSIRGLTKIVTLKSVPCTLLKGKVLDEPAVCRNDSTASIAGVGVYAREKSSTVEAIQTAMRNEKISVCPNPLTSDGCAQLFESIAKPVIEEIFDFIRTTKPLVEVELAASPKG